MRKTRTAVFYAKKCTSGFYAIFVNGNKEAINASYNDISNVRNYIDSVARINKLNSFTLTFNENEYSYYLSME